MDIAVLAWGSLVWQGSNAHGRLILREDAEWHDDGPALPVEFARISSDGRLTLVLVPGLVEPSHVMWAASGFTTLRHAMQNLAERETGAPLEAIHGVTSEGTVHGAPSRAVEGVVHEWLSTVPGLDAAIWTGLAPGPRWADKGYSGFSAESAVAYFASLQGELRERAVEYVRRAPTQIDTPVRRALLALLDGDPF